MHCTLRIAHSGLALLACAWWLLAAGCGGSASPVESNSKAIAEINVFAAASMTDVVNDLKAAWEAGGELKVKTSFGATSDLARQVMEGAPCDVFISADKAWMDKLKDKGSIEGDARVIATNRLVCIVKSDSTLAADAPKDLASEGFRQIAIADENVPAGKYAREALSKLNLLETLKARLVGQKDVRAALKAVSSGECEAGFVYASDAQADKGVRVLFLFDAGLHAPVVYPAAICKGAKNSEGAKRFLDFALSKEGQAVFAKRGFGPGGAP